MNHIIRTALALAALSLLAGCAQISALQGYQTLIDGGKGIDNFSFVGGANWRAEADAIVADRRPDALGTHYLATKQSYKDFTLRAEFWVSDDANSGIYVRCDP